MSRLRLCAALAGLFILSCVSSQVAAQLSAREHCAKGKKDLYHQLARTTVADPEENQYDVKHVKLDLNITDQNASVSGSASTTAMTTQAMQRYVFELHPGYIIDSLKINGAHSPLVVSIDLVRKATMPTSVAIGSLFTAEVFYHGEIQTGPEFFSTGIRTLEVPNSTNRATFTMSEPYDSRDWWPCKQSLTDKIDSLDIWLSVPLSCKAGSNGLLQNVVPLGADRHRYEWKTRYPTDYYLVSLAVSPYTEYSYYNHFPGSSDSMLVQNYLFAHSGLTPADKALSDSTGLHINYFSELFGRYPFWKEKYGHSLVVLFGGMEHQTMTSLGFLESFLIAHELAHQWWGDHVTCGSWHDLWMNESFATYAEYLYAAHFRGAADGAREMRETQQRVMEEPGGSVYIPDTTDERRMFSGRLTYDKGSTVIHMLRFVAPDDAAFFSLLKQYQQAHSFGTGTTQDFQAMAEQVYGQDLDTFFSQWIYGEGFPTIGAAWNQAGNQVVIHLNQSASMPSSIPLFTTPLELQLSSVQGDTTVKVYLNKETHDFVFNWDRPVQTIVIDPNNWLLNDTGLIYRDGTLTPPAGGSMAGVQIRPNPARTAWELRALPAHSRLHLTDASGRFIWEGGNKQEEVISIPAGNLASGLYFLRIESEGGFKSTTKLLRQ